MPLDVSSMQIIGTSPQAIPTAYGPKFFSDKLTGRGGKSPGILSQANSPLSISPGARTQPTDHETRLYRIHQNATTITHLPMNPLSDDAMDYMQHVERPDFADMVKVAYDNGVELWMRMEIQAITIQDTDIPADPLTGAKHYVAHDYQICYAATYYRVSDPADPVHELESHPNLFLRSGGNVYWTEYSSNPMAEICSNTVQQLLAAAWIVDQAGLKQYLLNYDVYDTVCRRSEEWQSKMDAIMDAFVKNIAPKAHNDQTAFRALRRQIKYLMSYNIPLEQYRSIYRSLRAAFSPQEANTLCKQNLNLLLSDTMDKLAAVKSSIAGFAPPPNGTPPRGRFSQQQLAAVTAPDPLVLVQSGAGTGKSSTILGRIDYMIANGVNPNDIMVISFTNAAADHIREKNPRLKSMTIAKMIHTIYALNFPGHELSEIDTLVNTLDIYFPAQLGQNRNVVDDFQRHLRAIRKNEPSAYTDMNNFVENNYQDVIRMLDTVSQTTLDLEIIICYQMIDHLVEPPEIQSKYLVIDEVQDNSVFEFIYTLRYVTKHQEPLFLVGKLRLPTLNPTNCGKAPRLCA